MSDGFTIPLNKSLFAVVILVVLGGAFFLLTPSVETQPTSSTTTQSSISLNTQETTSGPSVKEFDVAISGFNYSPASVNVNLGDTVVINIKNNDSVTHGISLPPFGVSSFVRPGTTQRIEFVADKTGAPETFCSTDHGEKLLINVTA